MMLTLVTATGTQLGFSLTQTPSPRTFRENVPAWRCFHDREEIFPLFFKRVLTLKGGEHEFTIREKTNYLLFMIHCFQSLEDEMVRLPVLKLSHLKLWHALSFGRLQLEFFAHPQVLIPWKRLLKKEAKDAKKAGGQFNPKDDLEVRFLPSLIREFLEVLESAVVIHNGNEIDSNGDEGAQVDASSLLYCERFAEFLIDLLSQLPTRRFIWALMEDAAVVINCRMSPLYSHGQGRLFAQLVDLLRFYEGFEIDEQTGTQLTDDDVLLAHSSRLQAFQLLVFKQVPKLQFYHSRRSKTWFVKSNDTSSSKGAKFGDMMPKKKKKDAAPKVNLLHHNQPSCYGCGSILQTSEAEAPGYIAPETFAVDGEGGFDIVEERVDGIMQYRREAFVVLLIFFSVFGSVSSDDSYVFVSTKQNEVRTIALAAQDNYANTCELVSTCLSPQNCSRLECYPISNQSSETTCVYVNDNKWCNNRTGAPCNNVEANFLKGYVRTPPLDFVSVGGTPAQDREIYLGSSICAQRNLDSTFVNVNNTLRSNSSVNYFYNLYFGAADGSFSYYPGRELLSAVCGKYDPRIRPWYVGAISILKDLVILIDTGTAMEQSSNFLDPTTSFLEMTTSMIGQLVNTLTAGDRVTVLPVNASGSYTGLGNYQYNVPPANGALDPTAPDFQGLLSYINGSTFAGGGANGNGAPTNFTDGFVKANSTFGISSPAKSMQIVILITNSESNNSPHNGDRSAADGLKSSGSQLFVYDLSPGPTSWGTYACQDGENKAYLSMNPLLFLSSYFSFLASARIAANAGVAVPFWQNPYNDASDLGQVITVAYPAMSPDGQLIGVAGIDVQMAGLDSDPLLTSGVTQLLNLSPYRDITRNSNASNIGICQAAYKNNCSGITPGSTTSLCNPLSPAASDKELTDLLCCKDCTGSSSSHVALWVSVGVLCGLFVLLIIAGIFLIERARRRKGPPGSLRAEFALNDYSYDVLKKATNGFATKNIVGKGSFGVVYKAVLGDETVAVKQLSQPADRAEDFEAEIRILGVTSHPNLVQLKGTCFQPTQCFLVYELVDSGDLHSWLWPVEKDHTATSTVGSDSECWSQRFLTWNKRRKIARGVARGLNYLHRGLQPNGTVFHLDIKPHNILLEYNFNPKIADFGISQLYEPGYTFKVASVVRGTFGYIAPEVLQGQVKPNSKLDVYSYGMVLLQLVSGRKIDDPEVKPFLLQWARTHVEDGHVEKVVDENLIGTVQEEYREALMDNCKQLITLSLRCLADRPEVRPEMSEVLGSIDSLKDVLDLETPATSENEEDRSGTPKDVLDLETPATSENEEDRSGTPSNDKSTDLKLKKASRSPGGHLLPFSGEHDGSFERLSSESRDKVESMARNPEMAPSVSSPRVPGEKVAEGQDFLERESSNKGTSTQDGSGSLSRSSVDYSLKADLGRPNMQIEPKSRTLRRSFSS